MDYKFKARDFFELPGDAITKIEFYPTPVNLPSRRSVQTIRITGSISARYDGGNKDETLGIAKWAGASAYSQEAYQRVTAAVHRNGQVLREVEIPEAFVINYSERFSVGSDKGEFTLLVREYPVKNNEPSVAVLPLSNSQGIRQLRMTEFINDSEHLFENYSRSISRKLAEATEALDKAVEAYAELEQLRDPFAPTLFAIIEAARKELNDAQSSLRDAVVDMETAIGRIDIWNMASRISPFLAMFYEKTVEETVEVALDALGEASKLADGALLSANAAAENADYHSDRARFPTNGTSGSETGYLVTRTNLDNIGFSITDDMLRDLNRVLVDYDITSRLQIHHFIAQVCVETKFGISLFEDYDGTPQEYFGSRDFYYTERNPDGSPNYYNDAPGSPAQVGDGYKYRGAGYIHLTWKTNYYGFSSYIEDAQVLEGATYVASVYPWESAGWYWKYGRNINSIITESTTVDQVTKLVNGGDEGLIARQNAFDKITAVWGEWAV